jgi:hypothetical protein
MALYAVNDFTERADNLAACLVLLENKLETITNTKTIRHISIHKVGTKYEYALVVDA